MSGVRTPTPIPYVRSKISVKLKNTENQGYEFLRSLSARWTEPKPLRDVLESYIQKNVIPEKHILGFDDSYILLEFAGGWKTITDLLSFIEAYLFENIGVGDRYQEMIDKFFENSVDDES